MSSTQASTYYKQIVDIVKYIRGNPQARLTASGLAQENNMDESKLHSILKNWAQTDYDSFLYSISPMRIQKILNDSSPSLFERKEVLGKSHTAFINLVRMSREDYGNGGGELEIDFAFDESPLGKLILANTEKGICFMAFYHGDKDKAVTGLKSCFPQSKIKFNHSESQQQAMRFFKNEKQDIPQLNLHVKGTDFQFKVWSQLLEIPIGQVTTYKKVANLIQQPTASRAVGTAIGSNNIAYFIPCHRVLRSSGEYGKFKWGDSSHKTSIIAWEAARISNGYYLK